MIRRFGRRCSVDARSPAAFYRLEPAVSVLLSFYNDELFSGVGDRIDIASS